MPQEFSGSYAQVRELKRAKGELEVCSRLCISAALRFRPF